MSALQSVQNGLKILKLFSNEQPVLGITEIATLLQLNKSTVSRLVKDLVKEGFLEKTKTKYKLGPTLLTLSGIIVTNLETHREAREPLKKLVNSVQETAHLSILEGTSITYLDMVECKRPIRLLSRIGKRNPASCTSSGKVMLAFRDHGEVHALIKEGLPKMGPKSVTSPKRFRKELDDIKELGYAICIDEMHEDVISIGAPIRDFSGEVIAAINIAGPKERMEKKEISFYVGEILQAAAEISLNLGFRENWGRKE